MCHISYCRLTKIAACSSFSIFLLYSNQLGAVPGVEMRGKRIAESRKGAWSHSDAMLKCSFKHENALKNNLNSIFASLIPDMVVSFHGQLF